MNAKQFFSAMFICRITVNVFAVPPNVIEAIPDNGENNVDPSLRQIKIVFDQDMTIGRNFSVCGGGEKFPKIVGNPKWFNKRTLVMRVKLQPNKEYSFSINCQSAGNCRSANGEPAVPYPITFKTGAGGRNYDHTAETKKDNFEAIKTLRKAVNENYSYKSLRGVNFNTLIREYAPRMRDASSPQEFAELAAKVLTHAKDVHIWVKAGEKSFGGYKRKVKRNYNPQVLEKAVPGWKKQNKTFYTGRYPDNIGYILINSWSNSRKDDIENGCKILEGLLESYDKIIIDVRSNSGGSETLAMKIARYFVDKPVVYAKHVYRNKSKKGGFGRVNERVLKPKKHGEKYKGKVVVLMGQENMSSCEAFLLMMKQVKGCKLIGENSYGSSANPKPHDLGNGVTVWLPSWKAMRVDGSCFEGEGIKPDITVEADKEEFKKNDPVLEKALLHLRSNIKSMSL